MDKTKGKTPDVRVSHHKRIGDKDIWTEMGIGFITESGKGYSCIINTIPINWDGTMVIQKIEPKPKKELL